MAKPTRSKSVLFDIELDDADGSAFTARDAFAEWLAECGQQSSSPEQAKLIADAHQAHMLALTPTGEVSLERFAQLLAMRSHHVWLRTGRLDCCCGQVALRHTFVLAGAAGSAGSPDLMPQLFVVDPCFKEQFQLPNATPEYNALWRELPDLFVGTAEQLVPVVELMCTEMQQVFADTATSCPPWRTPSCMLTKWLPSAADDVPVAAPGSSDSCSSSRPSSSATNSSLSSPERRLGAQPTTTLRAGISGLAPIRTAGGAGDGAEGPAGLTPRSARSPLYFDHHHSTVSARGALRQLGSPPAELAADAGGYGPADGEDVSLFAQWAASGKAGLEVDTGFMGSGSWGLGTYGSTVSSPGCDVFWAPLRTCQSEDGGPQASGRSRTRSMAIAPRTNLRCDQGARGGNGFAEALIGRAGLAQLRAFSPDTAGPARHASATAAAAAPAGEVPPAAVERGTSGGFFFCGYRSQGPSGNPTLDISRFDRNSVDDVPPVGPLAWGLGAERFGSTSSIGLGRKLSGTSSGSSSKPPAGAGAMCPPVKRRTSSTSSQCSALSAAIAGKGVSMR